MSVPRREAVQPEHYEYDECRRYHLLFTYEKNGKRSSGEEIVFAPDVAQAAVQIARLRDVSELFVLKRYFSGRPASAAEIIDCTYEIVS